MPRNGPAAPAAQYERVFGDLLTQMANENLKPAEWPWRRSIGRPRNALTQEPYHGGNVIRLKVEAVLNNYGTNYWAGYKQWEKLGGQVQKGAHGAPILRFSTWKKNVLGDDGRPVIDAETGEPKIQRIPTPHVEVVFNADQQQGWTPPETADLDRSRDELRHTLIDFLDAVGIATVHGGDRAAYAVHEDRIRLPDQWRFTGNDYVDPATAYAMTRAHENIHATGHPSRLNRPLGNPFGSPAYAFEELIAEFGAAFVGDEFQLPVDTCHEHAVYLRDWAAAAQQDPRYLHRAAKAAEAAVAWLLQAAGITAGQEEPAAPAER